MDGKRVRKASPKGSYRHEEFSTSRQKMSIYIQLQDRDPTSSFDNHTLQFIVFIQTLRNRVARQKIQFSAEKNDKK